MGYALFSQAKKWVKPGLGECSDDAAEDAVNAIRQHFYNWYADVPLFLDAVECFRIHCFHQSCRDCEPTYRGLTLPRDFQTVEAMWWNDFPISLRNEWREWQSAISAEYSCGIEKIDLPGRFPTAMDLNPSAPKRLRALCVRAADAGKRLKVSGVGADGSKITHEFLLTTTGTTSPDAFASINQHGGVIKDVTVGRVILADEDSNLLCTYESDEVVPAYRRIKLAGIPDDAHCVNIRAARAYFPLSDNDDIVETDAQMAFDSMARYLRLYRKADKTGEDLRIEKDHYATARGLMLGTVSRDLGKATKVEVKIAMPSSMRNSGLSRTRNRRGFFR